MNIVDSSGWLEYLGDGPNAAFFEPPLLDVANLLVPTITILEVFKRLHQQRGEADALRGAARMVHGKVVDLGPDLAIAAARIGLDLKLPLADSVILAAARAHKAVLWTQDAHFKGLPDVRYVEKR